MREQAKIIAVNGVLVILLCLALFTAATWWRLAEQFRRGEEAFNRRDFAAAVAGYESAIHMYIPFHPTVEKAARQLWRVGELHERQGDYFRALIAYRALRSSFYSASWLTTPGREWIARCDVKIGQLAPRIRGEL